MNNIKQTLFHNWHLMRWVRLMMGALILHEAILAADVLVGFIAVFFLFQALTNTGCCGTQGCATPMKDGNYNAEGIHYEEIKKTA